MTHEQVWLVRDAHKKGMLNIAAFAKSLHVSPHTVRLRFLHDDPIWYPKFETLLDARNRDVIQAWCIGNAD